MTALKRAIRRYEEFNRKPPRRIVRRSIDMRGPWVRIGRVPVITYESDKEGKRRAYFHETKRMPVLYYNPTAKVFLMRGGSIKVRDWLYD